MRKKNFSSTEREELECKGQMSIFDMLNAGIDPDEVVSRAESDVEDAKLEKLKSSVKEIPDNPIGLKTEGNNFEITECPKEDQLDQLLTEALNEAIDENESLSSDKMELDQDQIAEKLNEGFFHIEEMGENVPVDCEYYTLDDFAGSEPDFDDRLIAFDTSLSVNDPKFVVAVQKEDYSSIAEFKSDFSGQGGLNEHLIIAFPLKADSEPEKVIAMYEKKISKSQRIDNKNADKEAREIASIVDSGMESDDYIEPEAQEESTKKRGRKPKV